MRKREVLTVSVSKAFKDFLEAKSKESGVPMGRLIENYAGFKFLQDDLITNLFYSPQVPIERIVSVWSRVLPHVIKVDSEGVTFNHQRFDWNDLPKSEPELKNLLYDAIYSNPNHNDEKVAVDEVLNHYLLHLVKLNDYYELVPEKGSPIDETIRVENPTTDEIVALIDDYLKKKRKEVIDGYGLER